MYEQNPGLEKLTYQEQLQFRANCLVGTADFYSANLRELGHEAEDICVNNEVLQRTWAREHGVAVGRSWDWNLRLRRGLVPWLSRVPNKSWMYEILAAQIRHFKPDVLVNLMTSLIPAKFLGEMKPHFRVLIGGGSPVAILREQEFIAHRQVYDVMIAASEGMVDYFRAHGMKAELLRNAFEPRVLSQVNPTQSERFAVNFTGQLSGGIYSGRRRLLETLCSKMGKDMHVWATRLDDVAVDSPIRACYEGHAWGTQFYRILSASRIALNCHADIDSEYAENFRLFQATGMSVCLVTDWRANLPKIFEVGKEVIAYKNADECAELVRYYLDHEAERSAIARAGQMRTLRDYTFRHRAQGLVEIAEKYLKNRTSKTITVSVRGRTKGETCNGRPEIHSTEMA